MTNIIAFPGHKWEHCEFAECTGCYLCIGGLNQCATCGGMEGSLTTDCSGEHLSYSQGEDVYNGIIDYTHADGWIIASSVHSPAHYK